VLRVNRKVVLLIALVLLASSPVWVPMAVFAVKDSMDKFQYYVEALKALGNGLVEYFKAVIELFKEAVKP
jgi:hypothetical protein